MVVYLGHNLWIRMCRPANEPLLIRWHCFAGAVALPSHIERQWNAVRLVAHGAVHTTGSCITLPAMSTTVLGRHVALRFFAITASTCGAARDHGLCICVAARCAGVGAYGGHCSSSGPQHDVKMPTRWPDYLARTLYMLALVQMVLHFTIADPTAPNAIGIYSLYPLDALGSAIQRLCNAYWIICSQMRSRRRRRVGLAETSNWRSAVMRTRRERVRQGDGRIVWAGQRSRQRNCVLYPDTACRARTYAWCSRRSFCVHGRCQRPGTRGGPCQPCS